MTFVFEKERMTAVSADGIRAGFVDFPRLRPGLAAISNVWLAPGFREQGTGEAMMEALLTHLTENGQKAALVSPYAQQYVGANPRWRSILPDSLHFTVH